MSQCHGAAPCKLHRQPAPVRLTPDISVCIVNWNCRDLLRGCLRSLLEQPQGVSLEVIVVDNGSSDGAAAMVACEFPRVRVIRNVRNRGFARANNQAVRSAGGRCLFFLNNDTVVPAHALRRLLDHLEADSQAILVAPRLRDGAGKVQTSYRRRPTIATFLHRTLLLRWTGLFRDNYQAYRREDVASDLPRPVEVVMGAALLVRRDEFRQIGAWDEDFEFGGEDLELCYRANQHGRVLYVPGVEITHYGRVSTRQNSAYAATRIAIGFAQYFRKSGSSRAALLGYKLAITLDAPLQVVIKGSQYLWRRLQGRTREAEKSLNVLRGVWPFLCKGWWRFWRM